MVYPRVILFKGIAILFVMKNFITLVVGLALIYFGAKGMMNTARPLENCSVNLMEENINTWANATGIFTIRNEESVLHDKLVDSISVKLTTGCRTLEHSFPQKEITKWKNYKFPLTVGLYWKGKELLNESDAFISGRSIGGFNQIHLYVEHREFRFKIYEFEGNGLRPVQDYLMTLSGLESEE